MFRAVAYSIYAREELGKINTYETSLKKSGRLSSIRNMLIRGEGYAKYSQPQRIGGEKI